MKIYYTDEINKVFEQVGLKLHLSRKKFMLSFVLGMIQARSVLFNEIAVYLNDDAQVKSNEVRIQNFFRDYELDYNQIALLLIFFLPPKGKVTLSMDRTEWDFGIQQTNILMVIATCKNISVPLYWEMLDNKSGNSNTNDRIKVIKDCVNLLGNQRIGLFLGDREFIGHKWLKYLKVNDIKFCVRIPKSHNLHIYRIDKYEDNSSIKEKAEERLAKAEIKGRKSLYLQDVMVDSVWGNVYLSRDKDGDLLYIFGTAQAKLLGQLYKKRWRIEALFQAIKKRGFDLESTRLKYNTKLKKLVAFVSLAYAITTTIGIYQHLKVKAIPTKNHGYKENSFTRKGIDFFRDHFRKAWRENIAHFNIIIQRFNYWIKINFRQILIQ